MRLVSGRMAVRASGLERIPNHRPRWSSSAAVERAVSDSPSASFRSKTDGMIGPAPHHHYAQPRSARPTTGIVRTRVYRETKIGAGHKDEAGPGRTTGPTVTLLDIDCRATGQMPDDGRPLIVTPSPHATTRRSPARAAERRPMSSHNAGGRWAAPPTARCPGP